MPPVSAFLSNWYVSKLQIVNSIYPSQGGIVDDLIVSKTNLGHLYVVSNAGCRDKDIPLMKNAEEHFKNEGLDVHLDFMEDHALIAVQGPEMAAILESVSKLDMSSLPFMTSIVSTIGG